MPREYEKTHPWIDFSLDTTKAVPEIWMLLGEAQSKCEHIAGALLAPETAKQLSRIYLAKGAHATTAIEGNTLSEGEALKIVDDELTLPNSKKYLQQEVKNIIDACNAIAKRHVHEGPSPLSVEEIKEYNRKVLRDIPLDNDEEDGGVTDVVPGQIRGHIVTVNKYRGAPPKDCPYLLECLCDMMGGKNILGKRWEVAYGILQAIITHLYIAWIHPFGDGNGRTARLVEFKMCVNAGIPTPACHLLSNHYNATRDAYYRALAKTSRERNIFTFIRYAIEGYVDQLSEQIRHINNSQYKSFWINYIHSCFSEKDSPSDRRRRNLILDLSEKIEHEGSIKPVPTSLLHSISARMAECYYGRTMKTRSRDIKELISMGLLIRQGSGVRPHFEAIRAFLPPTMETAVRRAAKGGVSKPETAIAPFAGEAVLINRPLDNL